MTGEYERIQATPNHVATLSAQSVERHCATEKQQAEIEANLDRVEALLVETAERQSVFRAVAWRDE